MGGGAGMHFTPDVEVSLQRDYIVKFVNTWIFERLTTRLENPAGDCERIMRKIILNNT